VRRSTLQPPVLLISRSEVLGCKVTCNITVALPHIDGARHSEKSEFLQSLTRSGVELGGLDGAVRRLG